MLIHSSKGAIASGDAKSDAVAFAAGVVLGGEELRDINAKVAMALTEKQDNNQKYDF